MNKPLSVFFSIDRNYVQHFTVAVTSLLENNRDLALEIYVIHDLEDLVSISASKNFILHRYGIELQLIKISNIDFSIFKTDDNYTRATYFRLFLGDIIPHNVEVGLILDSDLIVTGSIKELSRIDMSQQYAYATSEAFVDHNVKRLGNLGISLNDYFNAGVMLINVRAWKDDHLSLKFAEVAQKYMSRLEWYDQDILNIYFANRWGKFDQKFNAVHLQKKLPVMPVIIHYASYSKPWFYADTHPYNEQYWKYLAMTPFKNNNAIGFSFRNMILKNGRLFKRFIREKGLIK